MLNLFLLELGLIVDLLLLLLMKCIGCFGFAFLFNVDSSQRLKRIGKVLIANVIMFPVIMMGLIIMLIN